MKTLFFTSAIALVLTCGCIKEKSISSAKPAITPNVIKSLTTDATSSTFAYGVDVSWLPQMEANGYIFKNSSGVQEDFLTILKEKGINAARLRTWVNPSSDPVNGHCSETETVAMAKRCKAAGLKVDIDFHFGDTWNSVGSQVPPAAWATMTYTQMQSTMYNYVYHFMNDLKYNDVTPDWVQIGNEENLGICGYTGSIAHNPVQMTGLLNAAYDMIKEVFPSTLVIIHLAKPQNLASIESWFDTYQANGGKWDVCGFSSYASKTDAPNIAPNFATIQARYDKPVMIVEVGGPETKAVDTKSVITTYINYLQNNLPSGTGLGVFYWEPEGYSPFTSYTMGAWDPTTMQPTVALDAFIH
ncbi:glycosyl hydrolase 53 family protein [Mucilaginibacter lappiensis]|uniref:Arabinogalactan endo-beta-1,4-galactanase n=1 Tax=Mucilaginibacter lappiensis TaxID=354630 RepID=A0A841JJK7_9SPHI|nr:glycosyl hydrolase 53 family protein [Mucilaginibacter lappiensis]MBB6131127.1 arabinogalactan endo-1,4-beta-galactosidase [Mucilaginibacter lappiensis]